MNLKEHNDIVEKLIKSLDSKELQINNLKKQLKKSQAYNPQKESTVEENRLTKKITQLNKEHKERVSQLTQQLRSKSNENRELKQRLVMKKNMETKEKQHVAQILKKKFDQKGGNSYDHKVNSLISHYEFELEKKSKHIENLQKQVKESYYASKEKTQNQNEQEEINHEKLPLKDANYHFKYQTEIAGLKNEANKYQRLFQEKSKQFKDLSKRYSDLTKDYYKIVNEAGSEEKLQSKKTQASTKNFKKNNKLGITNILQEIVDEDQNDEEPSELTYSFVSNLSKASCEPVKEVGIDQSQLLIQKICEILEVGHRSEILSKISKIKTNFNDFSIYEGISKFMHSMLYRMGMGKIPMEDLYSQLQQFQEKVNKFAEASNILDQVCIELGAKKNKLFEKIKDMKATEEQFFSNMKDIKFMHQLPKANKIMEFINYFQLDREIAELPDQLKKMYDQLKYVERFMKQANTILGKEQNGLERCLQGILRYLERKKTEQEMEALSEKIKKK